MACRSSSIAAIDTPYTHVGDLIGLERDTGDAVTHGFDGKLCLHPTQVDTVNRDMKPTASEIRWARATMEALESGDLCTLSDKLEAVQTKKGEKKKKKHKNKTSSHPPADKDRDTDAMALLDGKIIGPPHIKMAKRILALDLLARGDTPAIDQNLTVQGRVVSSNITDSTKEAAYSVGDVLPNPYEMTITDGMRALWLGAFYSHSLAATSSLFAHESGLVSRPGSLPCPWTMALYLTVSMSNTHGAIFHLGFRNGKQLQPVEIGDTVHQEIALKSVRNTTDGNRAVITTTRKLVRSSDGVALFEIDKLEMHHRQPQDLGAATTDDLSSQQTSFGQNVLQQADVAVATRTGRTGWESAREFREGELILHSFARPVGISSNLALSTLFLVTHPIHLDHGRYDQGDGIGVVVSGGLVIAAALSSAARDISDVVHEEMIFGNNVRPVAPMDTISAMTFILSKETVPGCDHLECLLVKTIGVKNLTPSSDLSSEALPRAIFEPMPGTRASYRKACSRDGSDLDKVIVCEVLRRVYRPNA